LAKHHRRTPKIAHRDQGVLDEDAKAAKVSTIQSFALNP
jgi:hypothetical protein